MNNTCVRHLNASQSIIPGAEHTWRAERNNFMPCHPWRVPTRLLREVSCSNLRDRATQGVTGPHDTEGLVRVQLPQFSFHLLFDEREAVPKPAMHIADTVAWPPDRSQTVEHIIMIVRALIVVAHRARLKSWESGDALRQCSL